MSKPVDLKLIGPDALIQLQDTVEAAILAASASPEPFATGEVAIPGSPTITQLPTQASTSGFLLRVESDCFVNSANSATGGQLLYEGDDIRFENVTNLDQVYVLPLKNQATTLRWSTL